MNLLHVAAALVALVVEPADPLAHVPGVKLGETPNEMKATHVSAAGDVNRDGFADVMLYDLVAGSRELGVVRVHSGFDGALLFSFPGLGNPPYDGAPMSGAGDVDGDGHADLLVGSSIDNTATLYSGRDGSELFAFVGDARDDGFGGAVAAAGDVDGDGHPDVIIGTVGSIAPGTQAYARVFSGADGAPLFTFHQESEYDAFGAAVCGVGDVNDDGHADLAVGAYLDGIDVFNPGIPPFVPPFWTEDVSGSVTVYSGADGQALWTVYGAQANDQLGWALDGAGDIDGDGFHDVLAGSRSADMEHPGYARVLSGVDGSVLYTFSGNDVWPGFVSVSGAGDLDGDGTPDVLVANLDIGAASGVVRGFSGADGSIVFEHQPQLASFTSVASLGDANGDGRDDFVVGVAQTFFGGGFAQLFVSQGALAQATLLGCGGNPPGSLAIVSGQPALGETLTVAVDDPSGSLSLPADVFLLVSSQPDAAFPCGTAKPGWGLASPGSTGELLVGVASPDPLVLKVGTYTGAPLQIALAVPALAGLVGETVYVQAALVDRTQRIGLTDAVALSIGVP